MAVFQSADWHDGEKEIHKLTGVGREDNPNSPFLTPRAANLVTRYSLLAVGTQDANDNIWCTLWGGEPPFVQPVAQSVLGIRTTIDATFDPVVEALFHKKDDGEVVRPDPPGPMISALSIHLEDRGRVKLGGRMIAGALSASDGQPADINTGKSAEVQLVVKIDMSLGNCPKYLNKKTITSHKPTPKLLSTSPHLPQEALNLIAQADLFFIASAHAHEDMDCNHRGGPPGFLRAHQPTSPSEPTQLVWPEYSGNNLYQTLGNLMTTPSAGIVIPDFITGTVLYLTGTTEVLIGPAAAKVIAHSKLAVRFSITAARLVSGGLPFRGTPLDDASQGRSPYNPKIRYLTSENPPDAAQGHDSSVLTKAKLLKSTKLTPTITRYRFALEDPSAMGGPNKPGQYVTLDFSEELDMGYSHMRDDDPLSINDDYIRTFTVSTSPGDSKGLHGEEFEITVRSVGSVTKWLGWQREGMCEIGVRGWGGEFSFEREKRVGFVCAGIGVTPLLGLVGKEEMGKGEGLKVWWSLGVRDVGLLVEVMERLPGLKEGMEVFLTGKDEALDEQGRKMLEEVMGSGWDVKRGRIAKEDLVRAQGDVDQWYSCTAQAMRKEIQEWLPGKSFVYENFDY